MKISNYPSFLKAFGYSILCSQHVHIHMTQPKFPNHPTLMQIIGVYRESQEGIHGGHAEQNRFLTPVF